MSVAYLQPTYAKIFIDDTVLNENLSWFQQQSRYAAATFIGLVETFSYRSLHVLFELATFPLSLGYVRYFPRRAAHYGARARGATAAARIAAGTIFGFYRPKEVEQKAVAAAQAIRDQLLTFYKQSLASEAKYILKRKLLFRQNKVSLTKLFQEKVNKMQNEREARSQQFASMVPAQPNGWFDQLRDIYYQIYYGRLVQDRKLQDFSIDPYERACYKVDRCKSKILDLAIALTAEREEAVKICSDGLERANLKKKKGQRELGPGHFDTALNTVRESPQMAEAFIRHLKFYRREFMDDMRAMVDGGELPEHAQEGYSEEFGYLHSPWYKFTNN